MSNGLPILRPPGTPPFDPRGARAGEFPNGARVSVLLGAASATAGARRVVTGAVFGMAVRGPDRIDLMLRDVASWYVETPPATLTVLPPTTTIAVRVGVVESIEHTLAMLTGEAGRPRSVIPAVELAYATCWQCGAAHPDVNSCCTKCGARLASGVPWQDTLVAGYIPKPSICPLCWTRRWADDEACGTCGVLRSDLQALLSMEARPISFLLQRGGSVIGTAEGRVRSVTLSRGGLEVLQQQVRVTCDTLAFTPHRSFVRTAVRSFAQLRAPNPELEFAFSFRLPTEGVSAALRWLASPHRARMTEHLVPCSCTVNGAVPDGPFCTRCGQRCALIGLNRPPRRFREANQLRTHACGWAPRARADRFCGGCGEALPSHDAALDTIANRLDRL